MTSKAELRNRIKKYKKEISRYQKRLYRINRLVAVGVDTIEHKNLKIAQLTSVLMQENKATVKAGLRASDVADQTKLRAAG